MKTSRAILGVLAGLAAGAAIGILFAPASGKRTRRTMTRKGEDLIEDLGDLVDDRVNTALRKFGGKISSGNGSSGPNQNREVRHATTDN